MKKHYDISISGKVQKVGFRFYAMQAAYKFGIKGYVRNMLDGSVFIEAEGQDSDLLKFLNWCKNGPPGSNIRNIFHNEGEVREYPDFEIK